ncbi:hypothetical protein BDW22DRAFT_943763 [Trametopsis cervina]|nr:hypothetical protein BDW22DRAFT_943763 [Trametopsis cervina]
MNDPRMFARSMYITEREPSRYPALPNQSHELPRIRKTNTERPHRIQYVSRAKPGRTTSESRPAHARERRRHKGLARAGKRTRSPRMVTRGYSPRVCVDHDRYILNARMRGTKAKPAKDAQGLNWEQKSYARWGCRHVRTYRKTLGEFRFRPSFYRSPERARTCEPDGQLHTLSQLYPWQVGAPTVAGLLHPGQANTPCECWIRGCSVVLWSGEHEYRAFPVAAAIRACVRLLCPTPCAVSRFVRSPDSQSCRSGSRSLSC